MESLLSQVPGQRKSTPSQQEFLLQGSIVNDTVEDLLHRLRGLCDNPDSAPEVFHDHEMVFVMKTTGTTPFYVRVRRDVDKNDLPFHLRYLGQPELGDKNRSTLVRSCVDVACSSNVTKFLSEMGFKLDYEFTSKGFIFKKGRMKVTVAKIFQKSVFDAQAGGFKDPDPVSKSYLVELSVVAPSGQDGLAEEVKAFADQLKPLVFLDKIDHRRVPS